MSETKKKRVICIETGIIYSSIKEVEEVLNFSHGNISEACRGKRKTANGYHWQFID